MTDHLVWGYALLFHGFAFVLYSLSLFLVNRDPSLNNIKTYFLSLAYYHRRAWFPELASTAVGHEPSTRKQFTSHSIPFSRLTVPPNTLAAISIWTTVWLSSKVNQRAPFIICAAGLAIVGRLLLTGTLIDFLFDHFPGYIVLLTTSTGQYLKHLDVHPSSSPFLCLK